MDSNFVEIKKPDDVGDEPHWAIMVFDTYVAYTGYESESGGGGQSILTRVYITADKAAWEDKIKEIEASNSSIKNSYEKKTVYSAYYVGAVASVETRITVKTMVS